MQVPLIPFFERVRLTMAGRQIKDRKRLAYTFTLHTEKDAKLIEYLEDKSITAIVKEALNSQMNGNLNIPAGKVLIDNEELMRLVSLATGNVIPQKTVVPLENQSDKSVQQNEPVKSEGSEKSEQPKKPELTEKEKDQLAKVASKVKIGIGKKINKS